MDTKKILIAIAVVVAVVAVVMFVLSMDGTTPDTDPVTDNGTIGEDIVDETFEFEFFEIDDNQIVIDEGAETVVEPEADSDTENVE